MTSKKHQKAVHPPAAASQGSWPADYKYLAVIVLFGMALTGLLFKGMSAYGDDSSYAAFVPAVLSGQYAENADIFSLRPVVIIPLAAAVGLLGYTDLASGAFAALCYAAAIVVTFTLGKKLYDPRAGLIAAFLFAIYPLSLEFNSSPSPMMPLVLLMSISMLLFIEGKARSSAPRFWLSGAFTFLGALANPLAYIYLLFYSAYIVISSSKASLDSGRIRLDGAQLMYFVGFTTALVAFGAVNMFVLGTQPFHEIGLTSSYYGAAGGPDEIYYTNPSLTFYINGYFPYGFSTIITSLFGPAGLGGAYSSALGIANGIFSLHGINVNSVGLFSYFVLAAAIYLAVARDGRPRFVLLWAAFIVLYMEFGTMSLTHYFPIYKLMRFTSIASVPLMIILGIALSRFLGGPAGRGGAGRHIAAYLLIAVLLATSLPLDYWYYLYNHNGMQFIRVDAGYLDSAQNISASNVYAPALDPFYLAYYMGFRRLASLNEYDNGSYGGLYIPNCSQIRNDSYVIIPSASDISAINGYNLWSIDEPWATNPSECGLSLYRDVYSNASIPNSSISDRMFGGNIYYKG